MFSLDIVIEDILYIIDYIVSNIFIGLYSFFVTGGRKMSKIRTF